MEIKLNLYLALAINGFFTGLGVILAQHLYNYYLKKRIIKFQKIIKLKGDKNEITKNE